MEETARAATDKQLKYLATYRENLNQGIEYYLQLIRDFKVKFDESRGSFVADLERLKAELNDLKVAGETNVVEFTH
jgi:poly-beta-hydroxyalkanoate depolymerase